LTPYVAAADALITTAAVPGRPAPMLVTSAMVEQMSPGAVVVDLAAEQGGNVEGSSPGETVRIGHALVWGGVNVPSQMPGPASRLLSTNIANLITLMTADPDEDEQPEPAGHSEQPEAGPEPESADESQEGQVDEPDEEDARSARFAPDFDDEVIAGCCVVHRGEVRHAPTRELLEEDS
ncbi:MAG: hypothetical protein M3Q87_13320, partial [Actinomycetota bacterium]|nr:hypothetical protein [Actinomycetota bacterium]